MSRGRYPRHTGPPPPALPPETRTIGQIVAESLKMYAGRFWVCLPLGLPIAIADPLAFDRGPLGRAAVLAALAPLFTLAYVEACAIEGGAHRAPRRAWILAMALGVAVFLPAVAMVYLFFMVVWLGLFGWVVPVALHEGGTVRETLRRTLDLARADAVHAIGGIAALVLVFGLSRNALAWLLREQADNAVRISVFLADVVISPIVFLGCALLYRDLAARVGLSRAERKTLRDEATGRPAK